MDDEREGAMASKRKSITHVSNNAGLLVTLKLFQIDCRGCRSFCGVLPCLDFRTWEWRSFLARSCQQRT